MAENDKKGFSGLGELTPKKKNRVKLEAESNEPQIQTPKQTEKKTRELSQTQRRKYSYPKDDPYKSILPKLSKNEWIGIFVIFFVLWLLAGKDNKQSTVFDDPPTSNPYSQYDVPDTPVPIPPVADNFHGYSAIYLDKNSYVFGWAVGFPSEEEAKTAAYDICKKRGAIGECDYKYSGKRRCVAIAKGALYQGWSAGDDLKETEDYAIKKCNEGPDACSIVDEGSRCS
jgi:hypothetical protein